MVSFLMEVLHFTKIHLKNSKTVAAALKMIQLYQIREIRLSITSGVS